MIDHGMLSQSLAPDESSREAHEAPTVLLIGDGPAAKTIRESRASRDVHFVSVPNLSFLAGAVSLFEPVAIVALPGPKNPLKVLLREVVRSRIDVPLVAALGAAGAQILTSHSTVTIEGCKAPVFAAALVASIVGLVIKRSPLDLSRTAEADLMDAQHGAV